MKRICIIVCTALLLAACSRTGQSLEERADELCRYIPDHELLARSQAYMTEDFYALLDTMFYRLPAHEAMDHEWLYYFVTGNGGTIADYDVQSVEQTDDNHAIATILVREVWPEGMEGDEDEEPEEHRLYMERVNGEWLIADFDEHKADCIRYIAISRKEQALRDAIRAYLVREIGEFYLHEEGDFCFPTLLMEAEEDSLVYGDFWIFWYRPVDDTLQIVSGGNHSGCMTIQWNGNQPEVMSFEQTVDGAGNDASARRIFGSHYDIYHNMHSNEAVREAVREEQLQEFLRP